VWEYIWPFSGKETGTTGEKGSTRFLVIPETWEEGDSQLRLAPTSSRQEILSWVTVLVSPCPASTSHLIFHSLRSAEGTLEADPLVADSTPSSIPVR
jgi:hypothetical protein